MKSLSLLLVLLLANVKLYQCESEFSQTNRQLADFHSFISRKLLGFFSLHAAKILESKSLNQTAKKILLEYLSIKMMHMNRKFVESARMRLEKINRKTGNYMHWRHG